ncbi:MAG: universal stress protein [Acidimicrobiales bacterium]
MFSTIVVGADGSDTARRAVAKAAEVAAAFSGTLHIVSAYSGQAITSAELPEQFRHLKSSADASALLQDLAMVAREYGVEATTHGVEGDAVAAILSAAKSVDADLVVVGNKGMTGVRRVLGSVPNSIAHGAPCSVLVVDTTD